MATQFQQQVTDLITTNRKADKVKRWQELATAAALIKAEIDALKTGILEDNDQRFLIVEETIRESAPSKDEYKRIHGEAAFEENKKLTKVKRHVKGIR
jgi:hypothetical protein